MTQTTNSGSTLLISGIYQITNTINSKIYIGSSINLKQRFNDHKKLLRHNKHPNQHLQSSWVKYGEIAFIFKIIENTEIESLLLREQFYIDLYTSFDRKIGYNISKIAGNTLGTKRTEETKTKMSLSKINDEKIKSFIEMANNYDNYSKLTNRQRPNSGKNNKKSKPILQYDIQNNLIREWDSAGIAAKALSVSVSGIWMSANNKVRTAYGFIWIYKQ